MTKVKQITVFVENAEGKLSDITAVLEENEIIRINNHQSALQSRR